MTEGGCEGAPADRRSGWLGDHAPELGLTAAAVLLTTALTRHGLLFDPDSGIYLKPARMLRAHPSTLWSPPSGTHLSLRGLVPPGYSVALAVVGALGHDLLAARVLAVLLAAASTWLLAAVVHRAAGPTAAVASGVLVMADRGYLLVTHGFVLAEGLYTTLAVGALAVVVATLEPGQEHRLVRRALAAGLLAGLGLATRYVGLGVVLGSAAAIAWLAAAPLARRLRAAAIVVAAGVAPLLAWELAVRATGPAGPRHLGFLGLARTDLANLEFPAYAFLPRPALDVLGTAGQRILGAAVVLGLVAWSASVLLDARRARPGAPVRTAAAVLLAGWGHLAVLVTSRIVSDRLVPLSGRHVMLWSTWTIAAASIDVHRRLAARADPRRGRALATAVVVLLVVGALPGMVRALRDPRAAWFNLDQSPPSALVAAVAGAPEDLVVYSNREDFVYLGTGRQTRELPEPEIPYDGEPDPQYERRTREMAREVRAGRAIIVVFGDDPLWAIAPGDRADVVGGQVQLRNRDGAILAARPW